jgi:hypothetical protein
MLEQAGPICSVVADARIVLKSSKDCAPPLPPLGIAGSHCCEDEFQINVCPLEGAVAATVRPRMRFTVSASTAPLASPAAAFHTICEPSFVRILFALPVTSGVLLPPACAVHVFVAEHPYRLPPAGADVSKNNSPAVHVAGITAPVFTGRVEVAVEKSTLFPCVRRSTRVCPRHAAATHTSSAVCFHAFFI